MTGRVGGSMIGRLIFIFLVALAIVAAMFLMANSLHADTIRSEFQGFEFPCDGLTVGVQPFGCQPGETRRLSDAGEILTGYLFPTRFTPEPPEPTWEPPAVPAPSVSANAPEPNYVWMLLLIGAIVGLSRAGRRT